MSTTSNFDKSKPHTQRQRLSWPKRIAFCTVCLTITIVTADFALQFIDWQLHGSNYGQALVRRRCDAQEMLVEMVNASQPEVVHPYVGFVLDPTSNESINEYGFLQVDGPILKRQVDQYIVGITGGSVARYLCETMSESLRTELEKRLAEKSGKPVQVRIVCCAQQGFRQPQQLMTWIWLNSVGAEFDCLVNLDGFNEVTLYPVENPSNELCISYPRAWDLRIFNEDDGELNRLLYQLKRLRSTRREWAAAMSFIDSFPARIPLHVWNARNTLLHSQVMSLTSELIKVRQQQTWKYAATGPKPRFDNEQDRTTKLIDNWALNSRLLSQLCQSLDTQYVHILQPNLHLKDSKPFSADEKELLAHGSTYSVVAAEGYPLLRDAGQTLVVEKVPFFDGTQLFSTVDETVYADRCCHFNFLGNMHLARFVCDCVVKARDSASDP